MTDLPQGPFDIIYADPPWHYGGAIFGPKFDVNIYYPTMPLEEICAIPVETVCAENSLLFLWTTSPMVPSALKVGAAWGFEYSTFAFVWHKQRIGWGAYTLSSCEHVMVFRRGTIPSPRVGRERQFLSEDRTFHSAKPLEIRRRIERMYPTQRKLELFARQPADGWTVWGNQANGERIRAQVVERQEELL